MLSIGMDHKATAVKDRTGLFPMETPFLITEEVGKRLLKWADDTPKTPASLSTNHVKDYHNAYGN